MNDFLIGSTEILQIADAVAREKGVSKELILGAMEEAIRIAARKKYGHEFSIRAEIDQKTGDIKLYHDLIVVEDSADEVPEQYQELNKITLEDAKVKHQGVKIGEVISNRLPPLDLARSFAQSAKQVIIQKVREIVKEKEFNDFEPRKGQIISGVVSKIERNGDVTVGIGSNLAFLAKNQLLRSDKFKQGDRVVALLQNVLRDNKEPQLRLSRTDNMFLAKLFEQEVPEIFDGIIEIKDVVRDPSSKAKIAVASTDTFIDPVGSCVGIRGARVMSVTDELNGEKIDVIQWSPDLATYVINAIAPAEVSKVIIDEDNKTVEIVMPAEQLSIAIGRRGQNIRLASQLVKWKISVISEQDESKRRLEEFHRLTEVFMEHLDLEEILAQLLVSEGYVKISEIAEATVEEIANIQGLDRDIAEELITRAKEYVALHKEDQPAVKKSFDQEQEKLENLIMNSEIIQILLSNNIKSIGEFAKLTREDFIKMIPNSDLSEGEIDKLIFKARDSL